MRSFRFPLWAIALMIAAFVGTVLAIETARFISTQLAGGGNPMHFVWWVMPGVFTLVTLVMAGAALMGYAVLHLLHKTGAQRLSSVETARHSR